MSEPMMIDVWSDVVCPWCYIGEKRLEQALAQRPELAVEIRWQPFQLRPDMPAQGEPWGAFAFEKFGGIARAQAAFNQVTTVGREVGLEFNFDRVTSAPNTVDAHRLILLAGEYGLQWPLATALFAAYFSDGRNLNDHAQLVEIAVGVGLDGAAVRALLASDAKIADVQHNQESATQLGVQGVPFYVLDQRYAVSGAQPVGVFLRALDTAAREQTGERG